MSKVNPPVSTHAADGQGRGRPRRQGGNRASARGVRTVGGGGGTAARDGGQTANSPPAIVPECADGDVRALAWGFDTLYLAVDVAWDDDSFFAVLRELKSEAAETGREQVLSLRDADGCAAGLFEVKPYGVRGYEWLLTSADCNMRIGRWLSPGSRPSVMLELGAEVLWRVGAEAAMQYYLDVLASQGCRIVLAKASRVDLCVDVLLPRAVWSASLLGLCVCPARSRNAHFCNRAFSGVSLGRGVIVARIYDKALEIATRSRDKRWMYDVWGLERVPADRVVVRVEFQVRREALKSLGLETIGDVFREHGRL